MSSAAESGDVSDEEIARGGLLYGLTTYGIRVLTESPMNGGGGYTPAEVGAMTLDQVFMRLMDIEVLKGKGGGTTKVSASQVGGNMKVRTEEGDLIELKSSGPHGSLAARVRAELEEKRLAAEAEAAKAKGRRRRRSKG